MRVDLELMETLTGETMVGYRAEIESMIHELRLLRHLEEEIRSTGHEDLTPTTGAVLGTLEAME